MPAVALTRPEPTSSDCLKYHVPYQATLAQWHIERAVELGRAKLSIMLGGIGSGKTASGQHILRRAMSEWAPGGLFMVVTPSYRTFSQVTLPEIRKFWPGEGDLWRYHAPGSQPQLSWYWSDGKRQIESVCVIRSAQDLRTVEEIRGPTVAGIWGDEVGTWNAGQVAHDLAFGRLRQTAPPLVADVWKTSGWWPRSWYTGSPRWGWLNRALGIKGGMPPHAWHTGYYPWPHTTKPKARTAYYVRACRTEDNPHNGPEYAESLRLMYGDNFARQELDGDFVTPTGAVYPTHYPDIHIIPHHVAWEIYQRCPVKVGGVDWGFGDSAAMVAVGIDSDARAIPIRCWSAPGHTADQMAEIARDWEEQLGIQRWWCDPADPENILRWQGRVAGSRGVNRPTRGAKNALAAGRDTVRNCMRLQTRLEHPCGGGRPGSWYYSSDDCRSLNDHTIALQYADVAEETERDERRVKPKSATHDTDACRYAIHSEMAVEAHHTSWEAL